MADSYNPYVAPPGWRPTSDQQQQIQNDSRLQRLSKNDLYMYFNKDVGYGGSGGSSTPTPTPAPTIHRRAPPPPATNGLFGWVDQLRQALGGS